MTNSSGTPASRGSGRKPPYEYEIHTIGVDPAYQGQGIGRGLLTRLLDYRRRAARSILEVRTDNAAAIGLYESAGFANDRSAQALLPGSGADAYTMRRDKGTDMTTILAIESSCDETGVGIAELAADGTVTLLADEVASSVDEHARFGGVVPEIASRAHLEALGPTMRRALDAAGIAKPDVVAATIGPGLAGALLVGVAAAKAYAAAWQVPFYAVNHLGGHLAADVYDHGPLPECVGLLVSGGHTNLLHVRSLGEPIAELGSTVDDAAGEAYDKVARLLGLGYPGGKVLDDLARDGDRDAIVFPRGMTGPRDDPYAFSFSGLKTAVARYVESQPDAPHGRCRRRFPGGGGGRADPQGRAGRHRTGRVDAADRRRRGRQLAAARTGRRALRGSGSDAADPAAPAVHRQRGDDRVVRRAPDGGGCAAVPAGRGQ